MPLCGNGSLNYARAAAVSTAIKHSCTTADLMEARSAAYPVRQLFSHPVCRKLARDRVGVVPLAALPGRCVARGAGLTWFGHQSADKCSAFGLFGLRRPLRRTIMSWENASGNFHDTLWARTNRLRTQWWSHRRCRSDVGTALSSPADWKIHRALVRSNAVASSESGTGRIS